MKIYGVYGYAKNGDLIGMTNTTEGREKMLDLAHAYLADPAFDMVRAQVNDDDQTDLIRHDMWSVNDIRFMPPELLPESLGGSCMVLIETFTKVDGTTEAVVVEIDGVQLLAEHRGEETRLWTWGPAQEMADRNPGWDKLEELERRGLVKMVREGYSIAPDDRYVWFGGPVPGLNSEKDGS